MFVCVSGVFLLVCSFEPFLSVCFFFSSCPATKKKRRIYWEYGMGWGWDGMGWVGGFGLYVINFVKSIDETCVRVRMCVCACVCVWCVCVCVCVSVCVCAYA